MTFHGSELEVPHCESKGYPPPRPDFPWFFPPPPRNKAWKNGPEKIVDCKAIYSNNGLFGKDHLNNRCNNLWTLREKPVKCHMFRLHFQFALPSTTTKKMTRRSATSQQRHRTTRHGRRHRAIALVACRRAGNWHILRSKLDNSLLQTQPMALDSVSNDYKITHPETKWTTGIFNNGGLGSKKIMFLLQFGEFLRYLFRKVQMPTWLKVTKITKLPACGPKRWRAAESLTSFHDNLHGIRGNDLPTSTLPPIMMGQWKMMENAGFLSFIGCIFSTETWLWEKSGSLF